MEILNPKIANYLNQLLPARKRPFVEMEAYARETDFPIIGPLVGTILKQLTVSINARIVFELGSGFGYSALWMAEGLPPDGKIYLTDRKEEHKKMALENFRKAGQSDKLEFYVGGALEIFVAHPGPFDIILNDIDKERYPETIPLVKERLRPGGLFITDNILWSGKLFNKSPEPSTKKIMEFTRLLFADPDFLTSIIPLRDGIAVAVKL